MQKSSGMRPYVQNGIARGQELRNGSAPATKGRAITPFPPIEDRLPVENLSQQVFCWHKRKVF
jgi:hypothetical protein